MSAAKMKLWKDSSVKGSLQSQRPSVSVPYSGIFSLVIRGTVSLTQQQQHVPLGDRSLNGCTTLAETAGVLESSLQMQACSLENLANKQVEVDDIKGLVSK